MASLFGESGGRLTRLEINSHPYVVLFGEMGDGRTRLEINSHPYVVLFVQQYYED
jgi:hypothetical protein